MRGNSISNSQKIGVSCTLIVVVVINFLLHSRESAADSRRNKLRAATKAAAQVVSDQKNFQRAYQGLSPEDKATLVSSLRKRSSTSGDSDGDNLPDLIDSPRIAGTNTCSNDSDKDGLEDGSEVDNRKNPIDSDTDNDGYDDSEDTYEAKGAVQSYTAPVLTVKDMAFTLVFAPNPQPTAFEGLTVDELRIGVCVEVKGFIDGPNLRAVKVSREDRCSGSSSSSSSSSSSKSSRESSRKSKDRSDD